MTARLDRQTVAAIIAAINSTNRRRRDSRDAPRERAGLGNLPTATPLTPTTTAAIRANV